MLFKSPEELVVKDETINFSKYFNRIKSNWLWIVLLTVVFCTLAFLKSPLSTNSYSATSTLMIDATPPKPISLQNLPNYDPTQKEFYATQYALLRSNVIATKVIDNLDLTHNADFMGIDTSHHDSIKAKIKQWLIDLKQPSDGSVSVNDSLTHTTPAQLKALQIFAKNLLITPIDKTQLVMVTYTSKDPTLAANIANAVGQAYINYYVDINEETNKKASKWLTSRLTELKTQLNDSEKKLTDYLAKEKLINTIAVDELANSELINLTNRLAAITDKRVQTESLYTTLRGNHHLSYNQIDSISEISNHPQIRDITNAETDAENVVAELSKRYGPKHEKMLEAESQLKTIRARKDRMLKRLVEGVHKELESNERQERELSAEINKKKEEFQSLAVKKLHYQSLKQEVDTNKRLLQAFLDRQKETLATDNYKDSIAHFTDYALKAYPSGPNIKKNVLIAGIIGFGLALCLLFAIQFFDTTVESSEEFERYFPLFSLGDLPFIKRLAKKKHPIDEQTLHIKEKAAFFEGIRNIRTALNLALTPDQRIVMITSALANEGKTTLAVNLAQSLAQTEKVALIHVDLHNRGTALSTPKGLSELLNNTLSINDVMTKPNLDNLLIIPAGEPVSDPQELLSSPRFNAILDELKQHVDKIIIDTPASLMSSDALIVAKASDVTLLTVAANKTKRNDIEQAIHKFSAYEINIDAVVLNKVM
ncbi:MULTISPECIES: polysaccharide biosynthesis tyrosine autokinase [unclassified Photobacterium]|uniref:GumC family protein n=1 Tax=unclassified Photobacterium TaxID=2628852 RepID=UPI001EE0C40E|nr:MULTISPECIES: polysaccharide biosynthesis tyrosine autokinase [unclassified Photobacterium]MCG3862855.1 polysaccharide biosynthesis tyrosine autokinase [Photobacterium sp. Ph6]MCG3874280.1 polysaccharide biosynthesis tyrosine autokinase [Photobacterium sp. Ph5]